MVTTVARTIPRLDQINRDNVEELEVAWTWKSGDVGRTIECNPIIIDGVMFVTTATLHVAALNAATGEVNWRFDPWNGEKGGGLNRGVAYWTDGKGDRRIFHSAGDHLYALNAGNRDTNRVVRAGRSHPAQNRDSTRTCFISASATTRRAWYGRIC